MSLSNYPHHGDGHGSENATAIQGLKYWASSPESSPEPETEPIVASLLARFKQHPPPEMELESPEPEDHEQQLPEQNVRQSSNSALRTPRIPGAGTSEERLQQMPKLRDLPWRDGVDPSSEHEVGGDSRRKQIRFGCLLATRGEVQDESCMTCANGRGKFSLCIALDGFFKGACASCQLSGGPNRCTIKKNDDELPNSPTNTPAEKTQPSSRNAKRHSLGNTKRPSSSDASAPNKRRRKTADKVEKTEKIPDWESARPQWQQELGDSQARQQMSQVRSPWTTVNQPAPHIPAPAPIHQSMDNGYNGVRNNSLQYPPDRRASAGWATVNQPAAPVPAPPPGYYSRDIPGGGYQASPGGYQSNGAFHQSNASSYQNGLPLSNTSTDVVASNGASYQTGAGQQKRENSLLNEENPVPLIDMLSKYKQRQLYGLVSGLQGGIKHLQTELDTLKRTLGMDD